MSAFTYMPKPNANQKNMHKLDIIFTVSAGKFQQITTGLHSIIVITPAHTQPRAFYKIK